VTAPRSVGVIGAGIVGLAVARELTRRFPGAAVTVFEAEDHVAAHQSGHNSGVVHAGVYYQPGSLKARLCLRGAALLREFCAEHDIALRDLGKLIVASSDAELDGLAEIERRARANQVPGLRRVSRAEMAEIEPFAAGVAAVYSPRTASVDYPGMCDALMTEVTKAGGTVELRTPVTAAAEVAGGVEVRSGERRWTFDRLIVCAGLRSDQLAAQLGRAGDLRIIPFRGEYYELRPQARHRVRGMIYPVPDPRYPFLGVHLTRDVHDGVHVGPNAVLALSLAGYRWRDVSPRDLAGIVRWPGMRRMAREHWRNGLDEMAGSLVKRRYLAKVRAYLPELELADLRPATAGVRAQAVRRDGSLVDDFVLEAAGRVFLVRNAPSPAATSSLAIAEHIVAAAFD
jgi:(S)-2-hydroxyglutarate dehydrogenase